LLSCGEGVLPVGVRGIGILPMEYGLKAQTTKDPKDAKKNNGLPHDDRKKG